MTVEDADRILKPTVDANETVYQNMVAMLPEKQKEMLFAIAKEGKAEGVTSAEFIKRNGLSSYSSVQSSIKQLFEKELITRNESIYRFQTVSSAYGCLKFMVCGIVYDYFNRTSFPSIPHRSNAAVFSLSKAIRHDGAPAVPPCSPVTW